MTRLGALAVGAAPLAGGLLLGGVAGKGNSSVADLRAVIASELDLLQRIPDDDVARRAALERMIGEHVDALLVAQEKSREFQSSGSDTSPRKATGATSCCLSRSCCSP